MLLTSTEMLVPVRGPQAVPAVSARWWLPHGESADTIVVLAHGAGSRLDHPLHERVCAAVAAAGVTTLGFNFGYTQAGRRSPDPMPRLLGVYGDVVAWARAQQPGRPVAVGGRSMGGRVASLAVAAGMSAAGLVLLNYPLLPSNRRPDSTPRVDHWPDLEVPVLFVHGTRDRLFDAGVFEQSRHLLDGAAVTVNTIDDADHGFAVPKRAGRSAAEVAAEVGGAVATWVRAQEARA